MYVAPRCYAPDGFLGVLWAVAGVLPWVFLAFVSAPRLKFDVAGIAAWWGVGCFLGFAPSLAWHAARRGRVCREWVCFTPAGCFLLYYVVWCVVCCGGLLGAVVVVFVVLCCLAWAVGVFGRAAAGAAACCWGLGSEFLYRGVLYVCGVCGG